MRLLQRLRVPIGFAFGIVFLYFARPESAYLTAGLSLAALGLLFRVWSAGWIRKGQKLTVGGPYRWTRNPLYLGSFLMGLGFVLAGAVIWLIMLYLVLFPAVYVPVMLREEAELRSAFGTRFEAYRLQVPFFLPSILRRNGTPTPVPGNFSWRRVILNGELNAVVGFLILTAFLCVRLYLS